MTSRVTCRPSSPRKFGCNSSAVISLSEYRAAGVMSASQFVVKTSILVLTYSLFPEMMNVLLKQRACIVLFSQGPTPAAMYARISAVILMYIKQDARNRESNLRINAFPMNFGKRC